MWHFTSTSIPQHFWKTPLLPQDFSSSQNFSRLCIAPPFQQNLSCALQNSGCEVRKKLVLNPASTMKHVHYWIFFFHLQNLGLMLTVALLSSYIFTTRTLMSPRLKFPEIQWLLSSKWTSDVRAVFSLFSINCLVSRNTLSCVGYLKVYH